MVIYPAIDIRNGKCVRLQKGDFSRQTVYAETRREEQSVRILPVDFSSIRAAKKFCVQLPSQPLPPCRKRYVSNTFPLFRNPDTGLWHPGMGVR